MSPSITEHQNESCDVCKGAASGHHDHYALGRLRVDAGRDLGMDRETAYQMDLRTLLERWHASRVSA